MHFLHTTKMFYLFECNSNFIEKVRILLSNMVIQKNRDHAYLICRGYKCVHFFYMYTCFVSFYKGLSCMHEAPLQIIRQGHPTEKGEIESY